MCTPLNIKYMIIQMFDIFREDSEMCSHIGLIPRASLHTVSNAGGSEDQRWLISCWEVGEVGG